jgi:hypothetical protein
MEKDNIKKKKKMEREKNGERKINWIDKKIILIIKKKIFVDMKIVERKSRELEKSDIKKKKKL